MKAGIPLWRKPANVISLIAFVGIYLIILLGFILKEQQSIKSLNQKLDSISQIQQRNPADALNILNRIREETIYRGNKSSIGKYYFWMGQIIANRDKRNRLNSYEARPYVKRAIELFSRTQDHYWHAKSLHLLISIDRLGIQLTSPTNEQTQNDSTLYFTSQIQALLPNITDPAEQEIIKGYILQTLSNNTVVQHSQHIDSLKQAIHSSQLSLPLFEKNKEFEALAISHRLIGKTNIDLGILHEQTAPSLAVNHYQSALTSLQKADSIFSSQGDQEGRVLIAKYLGDLYANWLILSNDPNHFLTSLNQYQNSTSHYLSNEAGTTYKMAKLFQIAASIDISIPDLPGANFLDSATLYYRNALVEAIGESNLGLFEKVKENWSFVCEFNNSCTELKKTENDYGLLLSKNTEDLENNVAQQQVIERLTFERNASRKSQSIMYILGGGIFLLLLLLFFGIYSRSEVIHFKKELNHQLKVEQTKMHPHFIGNTLTSIGKLIAKEDVENNEQAIEYLAKFSRLANSILRNSNITKIKLNEEVRTLQQYLELEQLRLNHKFDFDIKVDPELQQSELEIPPMILQPIVENSIWHGLQDRIAHGEPAALSIRFKHTESHQDYYLCEVIDSGIGRDKARELKGKQTQQNPQKERVRSTQITQKRLELLGQTQPDPLEIIDLFDHDEKRAIGTKVIVRIPKKIQILNK